MMNVIEMLAAEIGQAWRQRHAIEKALPNATEKGQLGYDLNDAELSAKIDRLERAVTALPCQTMREAVTQLVLLRSDICHAAELDEPSSGSAPRPFPSAISACNRWSIRY
jgi:hypothetical protein